MIVCSCNVISDHALRDAACDLAREPAACERITPGAVFRRVGCRPRCGGCFPLVKDIVAAAHGTTPPPCAVEASGCARDIGPAEMAIEVVPTAPAGLSLAVA